MPSLADPIAFIEIDELFLASLGGHTPHSYHLFGTIRKPTYSEISLIECCLAFAFDSPCAIIEPRFKKEAGDLTKGTARLKKKFSGAFHKETFDPFEGIRAQVDSASEYDTDSFMRVLEPQFSETHEWKLKLPLGVKIKNALHSYKMAKISLDPFSRILNLWRSLEPITTISERRNLFSQIDDIELSPVDARDWMSGKTFDIMEKYTSEARLHFKSLLKKGIKESDIVEHFYQQRRCPVAHANNSPLGYDSGVTLAELHRDTYVLKVLSRHAIENQLKKNQPNQSLLVNA